MSVAVTTIRPGLWQRGQVGARWVWGERIPADQFAVFFERLAIMLSSGMTTSEALRSAAKSADPEIRQICRDVIGPISQGVPLYRALYRHRDRLPEIVIPVLEVGEVAGTLESSARRLAEAFEKSGGIERKYRFAIFDPKIVIALAVLQSVIFGFAPYFLDSIVFALITLAKLLAAYFAGRFVLRWLNRFPRFRMAIDTVKLALPHAGTIARNLAAARWGRSFATLWHAGVPVSEALEVSSRSALNAHFEKAMMLAARRTREGWSVADSLAATPLLPKYLVDVLKTGETTGDFGAMLDRFVEMLENEALSMATQELAGAAVAINLLLAVLAVTMLRI